MGYYVKINKSSVKIPLAVQNQVLAIWKSMNAPEFNNRKRGGSYSSGKQSEWWYSWMDKDYDKTCKSCADVLDMLGFEFRVDDSGDILIQHYDNKTGQEDLFFVSIAHLLPNGKIVWVGEDATIFEWEFVDGVMVEDGRLKTNPFLKVYEPNLVESKREVY